jgi:hypothetical protein
MMKKNIFSARGYDNIVHYFFLRSISISERAKNKRSEAIFDRNG